MSSLPPAHTNPTTQNESKSEGARWWEVYFVRYFVGTVVGASILLVLNSNEISLLKDNVIPGLGNSVKDLQPQILVMLGTMGLAFCYIASAPVLVLHGARAALIGDTQKNVNRWLGIGTTMILAMTIAVLYWSTFNSVTILSSAAIALTALLQLVPLRFSARAKAELSHDFYKKLTDARAQNSPSNQEYKESYRHLREHGNAFIILFFEIVLGIVLAGAQSPAHAILFLILWILPASYIWLHGTVLESRYANIS